MFDDHRPFEGENYRFFESEGRIDFFRAYRGGDSKSKAAPRSGGGEEGFALQPVVDLMKRLIAEYTITGKRIGQRLDARLLHSVVDALRRESLGELDPIGGFQGKNATEQFLAESLYGELLEIPLLMPRPGSSCRASFLRSDEWRICLKLLAESLPDIATRESHRN